MRQITFFRSTLVLVRRKTDKAKSIEKRKKKKKRKLSTERKKERTAAGQLCRPTVTYHHIKASTHILQHHCFFFLKPTFRHGFNGGPSIFLVKWVHYIARDAFFSELLEMLYPWKLFQTGTPFPCFEKA